MIVKLKQKLIQNRKYKSKEKKPTQKLTLNHEKREKKRSKGEIEKGSTNVDEIRRKDGSVGCGSHATPKLLLYPIVAEFCTKKCLKLHVRVSGKAIYTSAQC